jgi:hypothetical protein
MITQLRAILTTDGCEVRVAGLFVNVLGACGGLA